MNAKNSFGSIPLHHAASRGNTETVRALVKEFDADVKAKDRNGRTPFDLVDEAKHYEELRALLLQ